MKFVDEVTIFVEAGKGGHGCLSFRREKFVPFGGPDGGDGGDGGSVYLIARTQLNTLITFRHLRKFKATNGQPGMGQLRTGKSGEDLFVPVPVGTLVYDTESNELIGDLIEPEQTLLVARGGRHGVGNHTFKSSTNRAPRKTTTGTDGEFRELRLELQLLADVGLLGLPNAGKSTLITQVSAARPKVAAYPFTTLHPHLGVVRFDSENSFVIADVPGLIEGAAHGLGLGTRFLRHLQRTRLLLHLVDIAPIDASAPIDAIRQIEGELKEYGQGLDQKPRWLVFNKSDLLPAAEANQLCKDILAELNWQEPWFLISGATGEGTQALMNAIMPYLLEHPKAWGKLPDEQDGDDELVWIDESED